MDMTKLEVKELKALAYDLICQLNQTQNNLKAVEAEMLKRKEVLPANETPDEKTPV